MFINAKRILMAEVDAGSGNGAAPTPTEVQADVPQAQGAAPAMSKEMADAIASAVSSAVAGVKDSIFAEARRTFTAQKQPKPTKADDSAPVVAAPDALKLRSLDRALSKTGLAARLSDSQYQRAEKAFASEDPPDAEAWVTDYFAGFGGPLSPPATNASPAVAPSQPQNARPASDRGAPPPAQVPLAEADLITMSDSDRTHLIKEKGNVWYRNQLAKQLKGRLISTR